MFCALIFFFLLDNKTTQLSFWTQKINYKSPLPDGEIKFYFNQNNFSTDKVGIFGSQPSI